MFRRPALALLTAAAMLAGLTGCTPGGDATDAPTRAATATSASGAATATTPEPAPLTDSTAPSSAAAAPAPEPTRTAEPYDWAATTLWRLCQASWDESDPALTWTGFDPWDRSNTSEEAGGFYVARYRMDENRAAAVEVRDCRITGTPEDYEVTRTPPNDD